MAVELKDTAIKGVRGNVFRHPTAGPSLAGADGVQTMWESWRRSVKLYGKNPCIGYRPINAKGEAGPFKWTTYSEVDARGAAFASGIVKLGLCPPTPDFKNGLLGFYAKNRMEWTIGEVATLRLGLVTVPLYDTLGPESVAYVINQTQIATICCTTDLVANVIGSTKNGSSLKTIVCMDHDNTEGIKKAKAAAQAAGGSIKVLSWMEVEKATGKDILPPRAPSARDVAFFCYTSGTTGDPKGGMITHANMTSNLAALTASVAELIRDDGSAVHLSYLPLPHVFERVNQLVMLAHGGRIGFYQGDSLKILDDLVNLRPTFFPSVPRLLSRIYDKILAGVNEAGGVKATLFNTALAAKIANLRTDQEGAGKLTHPVWDRLVFGPLKKRLGLDRVEVMITGSAPLAPRVMDFLRAVFGVPVLEGYGQTESSAAGTLTMPDDYTTGHVGVPASSNEIALFDVPEMGYLSTDTIHKGDDSKCRGRGEICFRGVNVFKGYYKMDDKTKEAIDDEGWLHSGDIGVWTMEGKLRIVDRKKNIFKLSQGEYVAAEKIENVYANSALVAQSFVYGDSTESMLVAIVVPDQEALTLWATKPENKIPNGGKGLTFQQLCADKTVKAAIFNDMNKVGKAAGLKGFEFARAIHLEHSLFSVENNMLTPTFKLKRAEARDHYRAVIDVMYKELNAAAAKLPAKL